MALRSSGAILGLFCLSMLVSACGASQGTSTVDLETGGPLPVNELAPQTLREGQCGLFFWTQAQPHRFIVFENENRQRVSIVYGGEIHELAVTQQNVDFLEGEPFRRVYLDQERRRVYTLQGFIGPETSSGPRIERAVMKVREDDGGQVVQPVIGLFSCRIENDGYIPGLEPGSN